MPTRTRVAGWSLIWCLEVEVLRHMLRLHLYAPPKVPIEAIST